MKYAKHNTTHPPPLQSSNNVMAKFPQNNRNEMKSDKLSLDGVLFGGNFLNEMNASHVQVVPNKKHKPNPNTNGSMSDSVMTTTTLEMKTLMPNANNADATAESNARSFGENAGILILEIFGTIIGMTWQALTEIPDYFRQNRWIRPLQFDFSIN